MKEKLFSFVTFILYGVLQISVPNGDKSVFKDVIVSDRVVNDVDKSLGNITPFIICLQSFCLNI